ncbi:hypothetical protein GGI24_005456, partial [Coemansia furcata]
MNRHLIGVPLTELVSVEAATTVTTTTFPRADLMTVDTSHIEVTIPTRAASVSATDIPLARGVRDSEALQNPTLADMAANTEYEQVNVSAAVTVTQTTENLPPAQITPAPETEQADTASPPQPASPPPLSLQPEQLKRDPKTLKERFNYASSDCAAVVLKANREARGLTSILNSKKDMYMLNECSARSKFVIVELCDDILVDTLVMGNYEFFSSTFRDTMVYVSDRYPPKENSTWTL